MEHTVSSLGRVLNNLVSSTGRVQLSLCPGEIIKLNGDRRGLHIVCRKGALWITQADDEEDYTLQAGETFVITRPGPVLVQSFGEGLLQVIPPSTRISAQNGQPQPMPSR